MFGHRFLRNFGIIPLLLVLVQQPTPAHAGTVDMLAEMHASTEVVAEEVVETTAHEEDFFMVMDVSAVEETTEATEAIEEEVVEETTEVTEATVAIEEEVVEETTEATEATEAIEEEVVEETTEVIEATEAIEEVVEETIEVTEATEAIEEEVVEETVEVTEATEAIEEEVVEETIEVTETTEVNESVEEETVEEKYAKWHTGNLTARKGFITNGPAGENGDDGYETWYDLDMTGVIKIMRGLGYSEEEYPYWVREDGCKMFGPYIMVAGDIVNTRERGDIIEVSLGTAMVCDYCEFSVKWNPYQIDVATDWAHTYNIRN